MIRTIEDVRGGFTLRTDVCVVGSGAGGGLAAGVVAEAGREVVLLEEGPHVPAAEMTQREDQMYPLLYRDGGNQLTHDGGVSVLQGRVMGGSTVINMADIDPICDAVLTHWRHRYGLSRWGIEDVRQADHLCRVAIGTNQIPRAGLNRNNALLLEGAEKTGLATHTFEHNRVGCVGSGYCLIGCAYDAKRSVALTWVPRALATGLATVQTHARVSRLLTSGRRVVAAVGDVVDDVSQASVATFRVEADEFLLGAGAIHSPLVLARSGLGGDAVGQNLSLQPQVPVAAVFPDDVEMFRGIPQAAYAGLEDQSEQTGLGGFRLEAVSAGPGMAATISTLVGADVHRFMTRYRQAAACLCLVPDQPGGTVRIDGDDRPRISYALSDDCKQRLLASVRAATAVYLAAGAQSVMVPFRGVGMITQVDQLDGLGTEVFLSGTVPVISAHPQGTCRMGPDAATSVVGLDGRVHGVDNLRVVDASVFPSSASTHTMLPVMSFSMLTTGELVGR